MGGEVEGTHEVITRSLRDGAPDSAAYYRHSARFAGGAGRQLLGDGAGIVGITCVSNLLAGGWKALRLGLPSQCVLLDHCGCRKHRHGAGVTTGIDEAARRLVLATD